MSCCYTIKNIGYVETSDVLVFNCLLYSVEELFHRVVKHTEICSSPDNVLVNNLYFLMKFMPAFMKIIQKMEVFIIFMTFLTP